MREDAFIEQALKKLSSRLNKPKLSFFVKNKGIGWEKWIQMELGYVLSHFFEAKVEFETSSAYSGTRKTTAHKIKMGFKNGFVDLRYKRKHLKTFQGDDRYTVIEIKMSDSHSAIRGALSDLNKIKAFRSTEWEFRAVYSVIFIKTKQRNMPHKKLVDKLVNMNIVKAVDIKLPGFTVLIFGWEAPLKKSGTSAEFDTWFNSTRKLFVDDNGNNIGPIFKSPKKKK